MHAKGAGETLRCAERLLALAYRSHQWVRLTPAGPSAHPSLMRLPPPRWHPCLLTARLPVLHCALPHLSQQWPLLRSLSSGPVHAHEPLSGLFFQCWGEAMPPGKFGSGFEGTSIVIGVAGERTLPGVLRFRGAGDVGAGFAGCCTDSKGLLLPTSCFAAPCTSGHAWVETSMCTSQQAKGMPPP